MTTDKKYFFGKPPDTLFMASADSDIDGWKGFHRDLYWFDGQKYIPTNFHRHIKNYPKNL